MAVMSVTLDVSKLTGWLNAHARCRVERRAYAMCWARRAGREAWELGRGAAAGASGAHAEDPTGGLGVGHAR